MNDTSTVYVDTSGVHDFKTMDYVMQNGVLFEEPGIIAFKGDRYYLVDEEDFSLSPKAGLKMKPDKFNQGNTSVFLFDKNRIIYSQNDSIFTNNFKDPKRKFIEKYEENPIPFFNDRYIVLSDNRVYDFKKRKTITIPCRNIRSIENEYLIDCVDAFYNLKGKKICDIEDEYLNDRNSKASPNFLISYGVTNVAYYKGKKFDLPFEQDYVNYIEELELWIIRKKSRGYRNYYIIMDDDGNLVYEGEFANVAASPYVLKLELKDENSYIIHDFESQKIFKFSNYYSIRKERENIWVVNNDMVIDSLENVIIPRIPNTKKGMIVYTDYFGKEVIWAVEFYCDRSIKPWKTDTLWSYYNLEGGLIMQHEKNPVYNSYNAWSMGGNMLLDKGILKTMDDTTLSQLTVIDAWIENRGPTKSKEYRIVNRYGIGISKWYKAIIKTSKPGSYLVRTFSDKFGILDVRSKTTLFE